MLKINTLFKKGQNSGKDNVNWKGDNAGYLAMHTWVIRKKGKAKICEYCDKSTGKIEWANINHTYKRNLDDYISLCTSCHRKYDFEKGFVAFNLKKFQFKKGEPPVPHKSNCKCFRCKFNRHKNH